MIIIISLWVFLIMLLSAGSSPLYNSVLWDSAVYVAMGRALGAGKILYKDLLDNKGLYFYIINYLGTRGPGNSLIILFIIECIFMLVKAFLIYKIAERLYNYKNSKIMCLASCILVLMSTARFLMQEGNTPETYVMAFELLAIYMIINYILDNKPHRPLYMFIHGIMTGIVFGFKPNLLFIWGAFAALVTIDLIKDKNYKLLALNFIYGLAGFIIAILPIILYAVKNNCLNDMLYAMFKLNIIMHVDNQPGFIQKFFASFVALQSISNKFIYSIIVTAILPVIISAWLILINKDLNSRIKIYYFVMLLSAFAAVSVTGHCYGMYYVYILPFALPFACKVSEYFVEFKLKLVFAVMLIIFIFSNATFIKIPRYFLFNQGFVPRVYAKCAEINQKYFPDSQARKDEKLLVVNGVVSFYHELDVVPSEKYFYPYDYRELPQAAHAQIDSLVSGKNNVVIMCFNDKAEGSWPSAGRKDEINNALNNLYNLVYASYNPADNGYVDKLEMYVRKDKDNY